MQNYGCLVEKMLQSYREGSSGNNEVNFVKYLEVGNEESLDQPNLRLVLKNILCLSEL